jgi:hypothetical protein
MTGLKRLIDGGKVRGDRLHPLLAGAALSILVLAHQLAVGMVREGMQGPRTSVLRVDVVSGSAQVRQDRPNAPVVADIWLR